MLIEIYFIFRIQELPFQALPKNFNTNITNNGVCKVKFIIQLSTQLLCINAWNKNLYTRTIFCYEENETWSGPTSQELKKISSRFFVFLIALYFTLLEV